MALEILTHTTPSGPTYSYQHLAPRDGKPYLLFLHGFPESSYDWSNQVAYFSKLGYGIVCPDLLGYGGTSKPIDLPSYSQRTMSAEVVSVLDAHAISKVVGIAHDWGCALLGNVAAWHRDRFLGFAFLAIGKHPHNATRGRRVYLSYYTPGTFNIDEANAMTEKMLGHPGFGYQLFFASPDAAALLARNPLSTTSLLMSQQPRHWQEHVCPYGAARAWIEAERTDPLPAWLTPKIRAERERRLQEGGWDAPLCWYKAAIAGVGKEDYEELGEEQKRIDDKPVLFVQTTGEDEVIPGDFWVEGMQKIVSDLTVRKVKAGHWCMWEDPQGVNEAIEGWLAKCT